MIRIGSVLLLTSSVFSPATTLLPIPTSLPLFSWFRIARWQEFVTWKTSWYLPKYKPCATFKDLPKIFNHLILFYFLFFGRSNEWGFHVSGKIGNAIFTIFICIFTIFTLNWERALITFHGVHYWWSRKKSEKPLLPRRREPRTAWFNWIPAFAGMTKPE